MSVLTETEENNCSKMCELDIENRKELSIPDENYDKLKNNLHEKNDKLPHTCEVCCKVFNSISTYEKHKRNYPVDHKYYRCCKKIEKSDNVHKCKKPNFSKKKETSSKGSSEKIVEVFQNKDVEVTNNTKHSDDSQVLHQNQIAEVKSNGILKQDNCKELLSKIYKCQECLDLFDKHSVLLNHMKVMHKRQGKFKCQICEEEFGNNNEYELHIAMHGPEDKVICKGCKKMFDSLKAYYSHAKQNPGIHCFICKFCLRQFSTELMLEQHVCICQNGKPLQCACGKIFTKYEDVIQHSKGTKPFHCCSCPHLSVSLTAYIRHLRKHSKQKPYQCTKCDMKFAVIDFLNIHNKKCHSDSVSEPFKEQHVEEIKDSTCNICNETFPSKEDLLKHGAQHERVRCPDCGKMLKRNRMESHRNSHKTSASLCPECGKLFDTRFKLTQHIITTHNNKPVKCEVCQKVLKSKKILNEHMKTHLKSEVGGRVPQAICPMCGLGLAQKGSLARHILLTHEKHKIVPCDKTYTCQECQAVLPNKEKYYSHRRMHRAMVDRFPCQICGREFNKKQNLRRHIYLLHDEKRVLADPIYKCQICTRCFREKKNLKRHYRMVHKLENVL